MLVYRVEGDMGDGPYADYRDMLRPMYVEHNKVYDDPEEDAQPAPRDDGLDTMLWGEYSATASPEAAQTWFAGFGALLHEAGFEMTVWDAPDVRRGGRQVAFRKDTARMVASYPIMEYIR